MVAGAWAFIGMIEAGVLQADALRRERFGFSRER